MNEQKPWYKSMTVWGGIVGLAGVIAPKYATAISQTASDAGVVVGAILSILGRFRANKEITVKDITSGVPK